MRVGLLLDRLVSCECCSWAGKVPTGLLVRRRERVGSGQSRQKRRCGRIDFGTDGADSPGQFCVAPVAASASVFHGDTSCFTSAISFWSLWCVCIPPFEQVVVVLSYVIFPCSGKALCGITLCVCMWTQVLISQDLGLFLGVASTMMSLFWLSWLRCFLGGLLNRGFTVGSTITVRSFIECVVVGCWVIDILPRQHFGELGQGNYSRIKRIWNQSCFRSRS